MNIESNSLKNDEKILTQIKEFNKKNELYKFIIFKILLIFFIFINFLVLFLIYKDKKKILDQIKNDNIIIKEIKKDLNITLNKIQLINSSFTERNDINKINILEPYINEQNDFCVNQKKYFNKLLEDQIKLQNINLNGMIYQMYIYKDKNFMTHDFNLYKSFETKETINILKALEFYRVKNNIFNNKDIFILDIGGNIGWYPSFLGRFGYSILTFEPFERNYYILKKNYCMLNNSNVVIITKGLDKNEKLCDYYIHIKNTGNGMIICDEKYMKNNLLRRNFKKSSQVSLTKLSNFFPYLSNKNIALIKIDIEGGEGNAIEGGIEMITKYHVPFIIIEFSPLFLKEHGTDPKKLIELFIENGYIISFEGFLNNNYISIEELMKKIGFQKNCYFIYKNVLKNN